MPASIGARSLNTGKPWSKMDDTDLREYASDGKPLPWLADYLQRNQAEVSQRMKQLGLRIKWRDK